MNKNKSQKLEMIPATAPQGLVALFSQTAPDEKKVVRRNLPQMVKPGDVPLGQTLTGEIVKIVDSPVSTVKGKLLWLRHESGQEYLFPCTGVIRSALAPGVSKEDENGDKLQKVLEKEIGNVLIVTRKADKQSEKYKKNMFMFDVFTAKP